MILETLNFDDLPTPKAEAWKYSNLAKAVPKDLTRICGNEIIVTVPKNTDAMFDKGLWVSKNGMQHNEQLKIVVEDGASLTFIETHEGDGEYWRNMVCDIEVGMNAELNHYRFLDDAADSVITIQTHIMQEADSRYNQFSLIKNPKFTRNEFQIELQGQNASCDLRALHLLQDTQHGDTTVNIEHQAPHCTSNQFVRSVLKDRARGVYQGKIHVHQVAQKTDAYQMSNAMLLSDTAEMNTKPELEIYADDVACSHGTTTGHINPEQMFYLQSRGIPENEARAMLMDAFLSEVTEFISDEESAAMCKARIDAWLAK